MRAIIVILAAFTFASRGLAGPQDATEESIRAARTDVPPAIDGVLDDACWQESSSFENLTEVVPVEGAEPSERTVVRVLFDADHLYIAIRCFDSDASRVLAREKRRDADMVGDDHIEIVLDPFADRRNGYLFQLAAGGAKRDGLIEASKGTISYEWDGLWDGKARRDAEGWTAELSIPFKTISFDRQADTWGFNVQRTIRRKQEIVRWATPRTNSQVTRLSDAGSLTGLEGIRQGLGLTFEPYLSTRHDTENKVTEVKPGGDLFYKITPATTLAVTTNTDFAETEVDERIVNLTRFPIFFPEKRAFFLQDTTVFSFGGIFRSPLAFHSRRIGIVGGEEKEILGGVRVTGREGRLNFGFMNVQMKHDRMLRAKNLSVGRVAVNVLGESTAGLIFTHGDPATSGENTLIGGDFNYRTRSLFGDQVLDAHGWVIGTFSDEGPESMDAPRGTDKQDTAIGGRVSFPNDVWSGGIFAGRYGGGFRPALGFIQRPGTYELHGDVRRRWRPRRFIRRVDLRTAQNAFMELDGDVQTHDSEILQVELEDRYGDILFTQVQSVREVLTGPFEISDGVTIPEGDYSFNRLTAFVGLAASRSLSPGFELRTGDYYSGTRTDYQSELSWRPSGTFFGSVSYEYNDIDLPEGAFIVRIMAARADLLFSPELTWSTIVQYDNESENLGLNSRVRWEFDLGQEIYFVVRQGYEREDGRRFENVSGDVTLKVGLTLRF